MLIISFINLLVLSILLIFDRNKTKNIFSAGSLFLYFAYLPAFSNFYFSIKKTAFEEHVLGMISDKFIDYQLVYAALTVQIILNILTYMSIWIGTSSKPKLFIHLTHRYANPKAFSEQIESTSNRRTNIKKFGLVLYSIGLLFYLIYLYKIGGLSTLWANVAMRSALGAGLGYYHSASHFALMTGGALIFYSGLLSRQFKTCFLIIVTNFAIFASLGARGPSLSFIILLIVLTHYKYKKFKTFINKKTILLALLTPTFVLGMLQFRHNEAATTDISINQVINNSVASLESGFIARIGRLERDIVTLGYFNDHSYWYGASYLGIFTAPIPRTIFQDKPPVDSGMYLRSMALGQTIEPPLPASALDGSGWPETYMAGYMNFGFIGLFSLVIVSGVIYGKFFKSLEILNFPILGVTYFAKIFAQGPIVLSPKGVVDILTNLLMIILIWLIYNITSWLHFYRRRIKIRTVTTTIP